MAEFTHECFTQHAMYGESTIMYVPTRENVATTVEVLIKYKQGELREPFTLQQQEAFAAAIHKINDAALKFALTIGVSFLHESLENNDREVVVELVDKGLVKLCVICSAMLWEVSFSAHVVAILGTEYNDDYDGPSYSDLDILEMIGQARRPSIDRVGKAFILCPPNKKRYYDLFFSELLPVESCFQQSLNETLNSAIVAGVVANLQDGVNYLARTFMCKRLHKNPGYYNFQGVSNEDVANHLTSLVLTTMGQLRISGMMVDNHDNNVSPSNLGRISAENYINCKTIEIFSTRLTEESDMREILDTLCLASEFDALPTRRIFTEEEEIRRLMNEQRFPPHPNQQVTDPHVKTNALLQAHLSRMPFTCVNLVADQRNMLLLLDRVLVGLVKLITTRHWTMLLPRAIEINQMIVQALWHDDSPLLQLPHLTRELVTICNENNIHSFSDWETMENRVKELLKLTICQWSDITHFIEYSRLPPLKRRLSEDGIIIGGQRTLDLTLSCKRRREEIFINFPYYPSRRRQSWWVLLFDAQNQLLTVQLVSSWTSNTTLRFECPVQAENAAYNLIFVSDSINGVSETESFIVKGWVME